MSNAQIDQSHNATTMLSTIVVVVCAFKFLMDGVSFTAFGHTIELGHVDASAYAAILTPVLGAHGYIKTRMNRTEKVDSPNE